jgi:cysteine desulfurase
MFFYLKKLLQSWFRPEIYLDHASTTLIDRRVLLVTNEIYRYRYGNPGGMYSLGIATTQVIEQSRKTVAWLLGVQSSQIIFTRGGTESNNMAILGVVNHFKNQHPDIVPHIITSVIEHDSVLATCRYLEQHGLATVSYVPCNADGIVEVEVVKKALRPETILISIMYANNEIGTIQSIKEIAKLVRWWKKQTLNTVPLSPSDSSPKRGSHTPYYPLFHTDAIQAVNYCDMNVLRLGVDMMTMSGSKIYGPKSVGALFIKNKNLIDPIVFGGGQEFGLRSGTEDVAMIAGFAKALEISQEIKELEVIRLQKLQRYLVTELLKDERISVNGYNSFFSNTTTPSQPSPKLGEGIMQRLPNNINITVTGFSGESLVIQLAAHGFLVSSKSACQSDSDEESHVIAALRNAQYNTNTTPPQPSPKLGEGAHNAEEGSLRITLGRGTNKRCIKKFVKTFLKIIK